MYILHSEIVYTCITTITVIIENIFTPLNGLVFSSAESKIVTSPSPRQPYSSAFYYYR